MTPLTLYLAKLIGAVFIVGALMLYARRATIVALSKRLLADPGVAMLSGALRTVAGLALVIGHDEWGNGLAIAVTLFGWLLFFSGLLLLFAREATILRLLEAMKLDERLGIYVGVMGVVGLLFLIGGFAG
jgi:hydrogenase-4 membrane subunit HyfE